MTPAEAIRERLLQKREEYEDYRRHHQVRTGEEDLHGMWDCAINMAEVSSYIDALEFCLTEVVLWPTKAVEKEPRCLTLGPGGQCRLPADHESRHYDGANTWGGR